MCLCLFNTVGVRHSGGWSQFIYLHLYFINYYYYPYNWLILFYYYYYYDFSVHEISSVENHFCMHIKRLIYLLNISVSMFYFCFAFGSYRTQQCPGLGLYVNAHRIICICLDFISMNNKIVRLQFRWNASSVRLINNCSTYRVQQLFSNIYIFHYALYIEIHCPLLCLVELQNI